MGIDAIRLQPAPMALKGFLEETIQPAGTIALSVLVGNPLYAVLVMVDFLIVKDPFSYNTIIGQ